MLVLFKIYRIDDHYIMKIRKLTLFIMQICDMNFEPVRIFSLFSR